MLHLLGERGKCPFWPIGRLKTRKGFNFRFLPVEPTIFTGPVEGLVLV